MVEHGLVERHCDRLGRLEADGGVALVAMDAQTGKTKVQRLADAVADKVLLLALDRHAAVTPWVRDLSDWQRRHSLADLRWLARHAAAALACDDPTVLGDLLAWLVPLLGGRGLPARVLPDGMRYLAESLEAETPAVAALLVAGADSLGGIS